VEEADKCVGEGRCNHDTQQGFISYSTLFPMSGVPWENLRELRLAPLTVSQMVSFVLKMKQLVSLRILHVKLPSLIGEAELVELTNGIATSEIVYLSLTGLTNVARPHGVQPIEHLLWTREDSLATIPLLGWSVRNIEHFFMKGITLSKTLMHVKIEGFGFGYVGLRWIGNNLSEQAFLENLELITCVAKQEIILVTERRLKQVTSALARGLEGNTRIHMLNLSGNGLPQMFVNDLYIGYARKWALKKLAKASMYQVLSFVWSDILVFCMANCHTYGVKEHEIVFLIVKETPDQFPDVWSHVRSL
jgi:hypothetical protein